MPVGTGLSSQHQAIGPHARPVRYSVMAPPIDLELLAQVLQEVVAIVNAQVQTAERQKSNLACLQAQCLSLSHTIMKQTPDIPRIRAYHCSAEATTKPPGETGTSICYYLYSCLRKKHEGYRHFLMTDKLTPEKRSWNMSRIMGRDTAPELAVRKMLHASEYRFRPHRKDLTGRPDIVLPKYKTMISVHRRFLHFHGCKDSGTPKTNTGFWATKLADNTRRGSKNQALLKQLGWKVRFTWKCEVTRIMKSSTCHI